MIDDKSPELSSWQQQFASRVLDATPPVHFVLRGTVGSGKSAAITAIIRGLFKDTASRVLLVSDRRDVLEQYRHRLSDLEASTQTAILDFNRVVRDAVPQSDQPDKSGLYVTTYSALRKPHNIEAATQTKWDLVVLDATPPDFILDEVIAPTERKGNLDKLVIVESKYGDPTSMAERLRGTVYLYDLASSIDTPPYQIQALWFERSVTEKEAIRLALVAFDRDDIKTRLQRAADSSLAALERELFAIRSSIAHSGELTALVYEGPGSSKPTDIVQDTERTASAMLRLVDAISAVHSVRTDNKAAAVLEYLRQDGGPFSLLYTEYAATARYLRTIIEDELDIASRPYIVTPDVEVPSDLDFTTFILFDMPWNPQEIGRVLRAAMSHVPRQQTTVKVLVAADRDNEHVLNMVGIT